MTDASRLPWLIIYFFFGLYLFTVGPSLVPYRDAGEMATTVPTLGVLHPTSYPLYALSGYLAAHLPLANPAYRLNIFSALAMALAWGLFALLWRRMGGGWTAAAIVVLGALSYHFWWHAVVSEMYALNILFLAALLYAYEQRNILLWGLLFGLGLANRADLLLTFPAFVAGFCIDPASKSQRNLRMLAGMASCTFIGLLLYGYLPLRACGEPLMNWNDPSTVERLLRSLLRRGYGGGLDLLSSSYAAGENFVPEMSLYLQHLWRDYVYVGIPLALWGVVVGFKRRPGWTVLALVGWIVTGPIFIYLGNLPPNSHAVSIMEAAYLMPDVFLLFLMVFGIAGFPENIRPSMSAVLIALSVWNGRQVLAQVSQRENYLAVDYIHNTYISMPAPSLVVGRSDVPIFSLYYGHWIAPRLPGRVPIAQGLAASPWYQSMLRRDESGIQITPLKTSANWDFFQRQNPGWGIFAANDVDWPDGNANRFQPQGLVSVYIGNAAPQPPARTASESLLQALYRYRGTYVYGAYRDFFSNELVESYTKAWMMVGNESAFRAAWAMKPDFPYAPLQLGYARFVQKDYSAARRYYEAAVQNFTQMEELAERWKTFPQLKASIRQDHEQAARSLELIKRRLGS